MINISQVINDEITNLETTMTLQDRHLISTATLKSRVLNHFKIKCGNEETRFLAQSGFTQSIQKGLQNRGYRSVRTGYFVNLDRCEDVDYLNEMLKNADASAEEKILVRARIEKLLELRKTQLDGQGYLSIGHDGELSYIIPINEEEFMERVLADAV